MAAFRSIINPWSPATKTTHNTGRRNLLEAKKGALNYFFGQHYQPLVYFAYRLTQNEEEAEDIVADCFAKLWEKREGFQTAENIKAYLYISCRNVCLTYLRDLKRKTAAQQLYFEQLEKSGNSILKRNHQPVLPRISHVYTPDLNSYDPVYAQTSLSD